MAFDFLKTKQPVMKVCMMGPKAVGKTTVLTAVFNETQTSICNTSLNLTAKGDTNAELIDRLHLLDSIFLKKASISDNTIQNAGISATSVESKFEFGFGHAGKDPVVDLVIKDFPGEMVVDQQDEVINFIKESQCIFIAVDTPHLMERNGEFNMVKNKPEKITHLFKNAINAMKSEKLVIFIPLKCEKYFHEQRMEDVLSRLEEVYAELIKLLKETNKVCCCVCPIQTLGDVEFDDFTYQETGEVALAPDGCPSNVKYKYVNEGKYSPFFCSQPLYTLLLFVVAQYKRQRGQGGIIDQLRNLLWKVFNSDKSLVENILMMNTNRITEDPKLGYKTLCGGFLFNCKQ